MSKFVVLAQLELALVQEALLALLVQQLLQQAQKLELQSEQLVVWLLQKILE